MFYDVTGPTDAFLLIFCLVVLTPFPKFYDVSQIYESIDEKMCEIACVFLLWGAYVKFVERFSSPSDSSQFRSLRLACSSLVDNPGWK